jgi:hypothetical protein
MQTEIAFILDRSGSMSSMTHAAISGFNEFLAAQQTTVDDHGKPLPSTFSLVLFDHEYESIHHRVPIASVPRLGPETYQPRGSTALLDAIGRTIDELGAALAATPAADRPVKVIVAILTDGEENASVRFTMADINRRISHQSRKYNWEFLFLGANQDAIATASRMGIQAGSAATFAAHADDLNAAQSAVNDKISASRRAAMHCRLDEAETTTLHEDLSATLEKKRRK